MILAAIAAIEATDARRPLPPPPPEGYIHVYPATIVVIGMMLRAIPDRDAVRRWLRARADRAEQADDFAVGDSLDAALWELDGFVPPIREIAVEAALPVALGAQLALAGAVLKDCPALRPWLARLRERVTQDCGPAGDSGD